MIGTWPENPSVMEFYFRFICIRVDILSGDSVLCYPVPPLSTDSPEVIGLGNHSATVLVTVKMLF
jgi:hypothetical protein